MNFYLTDQSKTFRSQGAATNVCIVWGALSFAKCKVRHLTSPSPCVPVSLLFKVLAEPGERKQAHGELPVDT